MTNATLEPLRVRANYWRGAEALGGSLTVTDTALAFRPHALNFQNDTVDLPLSDIAEIRKTRTLGVIPNGLSIVTKDGREYRFVVAKRDLVLTRLAARAA